MSTLSFLSNNDAQIAREMSEMEADDDLGGDVDGDGYSCAHAERVLANPRGEPHSTLPYCTAQIRLPPARLCNSAEVQTVAFA